MVKFIAAKFSGFYFFAHLYLEMGGVSVRGEKGRMNGKKHRSVRVGRFRPSNGK